MTTISLELTEQEQERLRERAGRLRVAPEALAAAMLKSELALDDKSFNQTASAVLEKNRELYRRLA